MPGAEARAAGRPARRLALRLPVPAPWLVLGVLVAAQWALLAMVATSVQHDGWLFHDGGDGTWYYTTAWVLGQGNVPQASIGYGYSLLLAPLTWFAGPNRLDGLPYVVLFNALVLAPVALLSIYGIARAIAGRVYAYVLSALWVLVPVLAIPYFYERYRPRYVDLTLPSAVGLTTNGDYPSMVFLLVAAYFLVRTFGTGLPRDALAAGLAIGFAIAIKPANALFLPAAALGLLLARRPRQALVVAAGLAPAVVGLALWKYRGLGYLPLFGNEPSALAAGVLGAYPVGAVDLDRYFQLDWDQLQRNIDGFREFTASRRLLQWSLVAGVIGLGRRSLPLAALVGTWLAAYTVAKGTQSGITVGSGSFFTHLIAAFPAVFLLLAAVPLLVPVAGRRWARRGRGDERTWDPRTPTVAIGAIGGVSVLAVAVLLLLPPLTEPRAANIGTVVQYAPANAFPLSVRPAADGSVLLRWPSQRGGGAHVGYTVFRAAEDSLTCAPCRHAASACSFLHDSTFWATEFLGSTTGTSFTDRAPPGRWVYRVAARAAPSGEATSGDFVLLSEGRWVDVPGG